MNDVSPARRARRAFMQLSAAVSIAVFLLLGSTVLLDQWIIGQASARFSPQSVAAPSLIEDVACVVRRVRC